MRRLSDAVAFATKPGSLEKSMFRNVLANACAMARGLLKDVMEALIGAR